MKQPICKQAASAGSGQIYVQAGFQRGLSLVELMISITIGLVILVSLSTLFINQSKTRAELDKSNRMIDNGRYALDLLSDNLRLAGFYDNYVPSPIVSTPGALYDPCDLANITNSAVNLDILRVPVQGYDAASAVGAAAVTKIASLPCGSAFAPSSALTYTPGSPSSVKPGSDILAIRRASTVSVLASSAASGATYLQVSMCQTDLNIGGYQIVKAPAAASFASMNKKPPVGSAICSGPSDLRQFLVQTYFVSPNNSPGDGIPTLKRIELDPTGAWVITPLVEGIEYMQVDYGVDNTGDGTADTYTTCSACTLADWSNVVSVRINIVARNQDKTSGWNDSKTYALGLAGNYTPTGADLSYKRHAYTQVVRLVNPSGRRELP